jgi:serine/threonine-protein kinase
MVGEYRVTHKLGEGGMGVVYGGIHPEIGKRVAIKVLGPQALAHADLIRRFKEEARSVNKIRHPNIIDIFAFNQLPDGRHYFVMEFLDGESLTDRLGRGPMEFAEMRRLLAQICSALQAAHEAGVIHRDLKPDNIWVATQALSEARIKLLDFGIAKLNDVANASSTQSGVPMGTPLYMPPEQGMGKAVDHRVDIYSLGVLLYQVFAGTLPFQGNSGYEIVLKHVTEAPLAPSRHRPIWPVQMEGIILACLEKDPSLRPATAKELGTRIDAAFAAHERAPMFAAAASTVPRLTTSPPFFAPQAGGTAPITMSVRAPVDVGASAATSGERTSSPSRRTGLVTAVVGLLGVGGAATFFATRPSSTAPVATPAAPLATPAVEPLRANAAPAPAAAPAASAPALPVAAPAPAAPPARPSAPPAAAASSPHPVHLHLRNRSAVARPTAEPAPAGPRELPAAPPPAPVAKEPAPHKDSPPAEPATGYRGSKLKIETQFP